MPGLLGIFLYNQSRISFKFDSNKYRQLDLYLSLTLLKTHYISANLEFNFKFWVKFSFVMTLIQSLHIERGLWLQEYSG